MSEEFPLNVGMRARSHGQFDQPRCFHIVQTHHMAAAGPFDRITVEPGKCAGKPCIRGMRITVRRVLELLAAYSDREALFADYPFLEPEDIQPFASATYR
jgi:uncharacterized protein (DUF433 family)